MIDNFSNIEYQHNGSNVKVNGYRLDVNDSFEDFLKNHVTSRLGDFDGQTDFRNFCSSLQLTGFSEDNLEEFLSIDNSEEREWAVGEAIAESWLSLELGVIWPWNMERDKKTPKASLPGPDLIGFIQINSSFRFLFGEVKTSSEKKYPPNVMYGKSGAVNQLESIASDLSLVKQNIYWLFFRISESNRSHYMQAFTSYLNSGFTEVQLAAVLVRDTAPNELDLKTRGEYLDSVISAPTLCQMTALYLPDQIQGICDLVLDGGEHE